MKTNNEQGRTVGIAITAYMLLKAVLNMLLGGISFGGIFHMFFAIGIAVALGIFMFSGLEYVNYVVAGYLAIGIVTHLIPNILHITDNWIYLLEVFVDVRCAVLLIILPQVKEHFTNPWSEIKELFSK